MGSPNLTQPNQQFRTTEQLPIYPSQIQEFQIENWYDTYKSVLKYSKMYLFGEIPWSQIQNMITAVAV